MTTLELVAISAVLFVFVALPWAVGVYRIVTWFNSRQKRDEREVD